MSSPDQNSALSLLHRIAKLLSHHERVIPWFLFISLLALYLAFPTKNYYWDGITFAQAIEDAHRLRPTLIHPNHLIYNVVGYYFYQLLHTIGFNVRALTALILLNSILGAIAGVVLFVILKALLQSLYLATFLTLIFSLSATWWRFSTDADAYIISVTFLILSFYVLLPDKRSHPFLAGFLFSVSMCFHQLAVFFGPVAMLGLVFQEVGSGKRVCALLKFGLTSFVLTTVAYLSCFYFAAVNFSLVAFMRWVSSYSPDAPLSSNVGGMARYSLRGQVRLFFNGRFNLLNGLFNPVVIFLIVLLAIAVGVLCYLTLKNFARPGLKSFRVLLDDSRSRPVVLMSIVWIAIYLAFLFVWLPQHTFYRLFYLPPIILFMGLLAAARYHFAIYRPTCRLALLAVVVGLANFLFSIYPYSHAEKVPPTKFALEMSQEWAAGTVVYYALENSDMSLVRYFTPSTTWVLLTNTDALNNQLSDIYARGSTAWLETTAIDRLASTSQGADWLAAHAKKDSHREVKDKGFRIEFVQVVQ
ncbi:MAG TPA: hypothetical protein VGQ39_07175 [Pyrinomonadaceae bacterium]|nr:hypothetical protein [Pyrinomonadaceae bacterium]